jgi:hypothetical protein
MNSRLAASKNISGAYRTHGINKNSTNVLVALINATPEYKSQIRDTIKGEEVVYHDPVSTVNRDKVLKVCTCPISSPHD